MEQEITIFNLVGRLKSFINYCWKKKFFLIGIPIIIGISGYFYSKTIKPKYLASITFMVKDEDSNSGLNGIFAVLGSFGLGGGNKSKFNLDKVVALSKSEKIIRNALMDSIHLNNENTILADFLISKYNLLNCWEKMDGPISKFKNFSKKSSTDSTNIIENTTLNTLYNLICNVNSKEKLLESDYNEDNTIFTLNVTSVSDTLSLQLVNSIFKHLQDFYIFQVTYKTRLTIKNLENRVVFVESKLNRKEFNLARNRDNTLGTWLSEDIVPQQQLSRDVQINSVMYAELIKNLETAKFTLQNITPIFQVIDAPYYPVKELSVSPLQSAAYWCLGSLLIIMILLFLNFVYILNSSNNVLSG